jgi:hypothetical protein
VSPFIAWPWLALVPAAVCLAAYPRAKRGVVATAGILWAAYAVYEFGMQRRWLCSGECNIRVDLLLLYPILLAISVAAVVATVRAERAP